MNDISLIKLFLERENYEKYSRFVNYEALSDQGRILLTDLNAYYESTAENSIDVNHFTSFFYHLRHPDFKDAQRTLFNRFFEEVEKLDSPVPELVIAHFQKEYLNFKIQEAIFNKADSADIKTLIEDYEKTKANLSSAPAWVENDYDTIFEADTLNTGLKWRLKCLQNSIGSLNKGDFGIIASYVEWGKTAFIVSEAVHMATQLLDSCILWFNNEGKETKVQSRVWQAALNKSKNEILNDPVSAKADYIKVMNGDKNRIKFIDASGMGKAKIEEYCEYYKPGLIIIDQLDVITGFEKKSRNDHTQYKFLYQWARDLAKKYCPMMAVTQCDSSVTGMDKEGHIWTQHYIDMRQIAGTKADGKQGTADFIITIGKNHDYPKTRYIHVPKNKLNPLTEELRYIKQEVQFDPERSLYLD